MQGNTICWNPDFSPKGHQRCGNGGECFAPCKNIVNTMFFFCACGGENAILKRQGHHRLTFSGFQTCFRKLRFSSFFVRREQFESAPGDWVGEAIVYTKRLKTIFSDLPCSAFASFYHMDTSTKRKNEKCYLFWRMMKFPRRAAQEERWRRVLRTM